MRPCRGSILAPDPSLVSDAVYEIKQEWIIDFATAGLVSPRRIGQLHVADFRKVLFDRWRQVTFHDLHVVNVVLEGKVGHICVMHDVERLGRVIQVKARNVTRVDCLNEQRDVVLCEFLAGKAQIGNVGLAHLFFAHSAWLQSCHAMQLLAIERQRVVDRLSDVVLKLPVACRVARHATVARLPIARRHVEQHHLELVAMNLLLQQAFVKGVREQEFDTLETGLGRGIEAVGKIDLVKHHGKIGI